MKKIFFMIILLLGFASTAVAVPSLQLWFNPVLNPGAYYDTVAEGWETGTNPSILSALIIPDNGITWSDTFRIVVSLPNIPNTSDPNGNYSTSVNNTVAAYVPNFLDISGLNFWVYGNSGAQPQDVWNAYFDFTVDSDNTFDVVDVEPPGSSAFTGYRADFKITFADIPDSLFRFDLVDFSTGTGGGQDLYVNINPFSHNAQWDNDDGGTNVVPEPSTLILLGAGLVGLAVYRRKRN